MLIFYHFISAGVGACGVLLLHVMKEEESSGRLFKFLIAGTAGLWKCQEGSDREDLANTWGLADSSLLLFLWGGGWVTSQMDPMGSSTRTPISQTGLCAGRLL